MSRNLLSLDVGTQLIGVAVLDRETQVPVYQGAMKRKRGEALSQIEEYRSRYGCDRCVVGMPFQQDGSVSAQGQDVLKFCRELIQRVELSVFLVDETDSTRETQEAQSLNSASKRKRAKQSGALDGAAAVNIAKRFLQGPPMYEVYELEQFLSAGDPQSGGDDTV